jgi:hypothetical protein
MMVMVTIIMMVMFSAGWRIRLIRIWLLLIRMADLVTFDQE